MNRCFDKIHRGNNTLYIHKNFRNDTFEQALLNSGKELGERYRLTAIPSSKFARVYKLTVRFNDADKGVYFKQYLCRSVWDFIKHFVRPNRAERAFKASEMLSENGFDTPATIAMDKTANFVVTLEIENAKQILQFISDSSLESRDRRELMRSLGRTIGQMHARGILHGDLRTGNILARREKDRWRFFFIDNERTRKFRRLPARLWVKNLVQVNTLPSVLVSNADRMRFFREYCAQNEKAKTRKAALIKKILKKTRQRLDKKRNLRIASETAGRSRKAV